VVFQHLGHEAVDAAAHADSSIRMSPQSFPSVRDRSTASIWPRSFLMRNTSLVALDLYAT